MQVVTNETPDFSEEDFQSFLDQPLTIHIQYAPTAEQMKNQDRILALLESCKSESERNRVFSREIARLRRRDGVSEIRDTNVWIQEKSPLATD